ncbi:MAG: 2Fe-2S iron-sulfur cluster-binding protein [Pontibacterium sp.]
MTRVTFQDQTVDVQQDQTLLDALLDAGFEIPNSCRAGTCQSCLMQVVEGEVPALAQKGLKPAQVVQNYFFPCRTYPETDLVVASNPEVSEATGVVTAKDMLNHNVLRLWLKADIEFQPGQFVELKRADGVARAYSIANTPNNDNLLEFHVRVYEQGVFSRWLADECEIGAPLRLMGPMGECFYVADEASNDAPMLLAGTGTGLAPLLGIAKDALAKGHCGDIKLFVGAKDPSSLYGIAELEALAQAYPHFTYTPVVLEASESDGAYVMGDINAVIAERVSDCKGYKVFLCGSEQRVNKLRRDCFMRGASMKDISCDAFTPKA